jgi:DMSO/TMAO reductase YedYZ molybdopterin-dependent catalytic subunit
MTKKMMLTETLGQTSANRRGFLRIAGATAFGGALGATLPFDGRSGMQPVSTALAQGDSNEFLARKNLDALIKHSGKTYETKRDFIGTSVVTSNAIFFVRANLPEPDSSIVADADAWEVSIEGVKNPATLTLADLKKMGVATAASVLQCSGNGRGFFSHEAAGSQWTVGAAGCAIWSGVPLKAVVDALGGAADGVQFITGTGGEALPEGLDPKQAIVERSVPIDAMDNALLAWEMNGEPLPLAHGGPLRIIHPGYYGVNNVKYLKTLALTEAESDANIMTSGYRLRPVDVKGAPDQPSMWKMDVKSWVTNPAGEVPAGKVQITGVAFSGNGPVTKVEVSVDGGQSWSEAEMVGPDLGEFAWRPFVLETELAAGSHMITSRATDSGGDTQPEDFPPNHRGYAHNGWKAHTIDITAA